MNRTDSKFDKRKGAFHTSTSVEKVKTRCAHCHRTMNNFAGGSSKGHNGEPLCHPNAKNRPDCYHLVTLYGHETPCTSKACFEDYEELLVYVDAHPRHEVRGAFN